MTPEVGADQMMVAAVVLTVAGVVCVRCSRRLARDARRRETARAKVERLHKKNQAAALRALSTLREIDPAANPARMFGYLRCVSPLVFEEMILTALAQRGHAIERSARYSGDGGADGAFELNGRAWFIQAKRYSSAVNPTHVTEFDVLCRKAGARGLFVHTGRTGPRSRANERQSELVRIVAGQDLVALFAGHPVQLLRPGRDPQRPN